MSLRMRARFFWPRLGFLLWTPWKQQWNFWLHKSRGFPGTVQRLSPSEEPFFSVILTWSAVEMLFFTHNHFSNGILCFLILSIFCIKIIKLSIKHYVFGTASAPVFRLNIRLRPTQMSQIGKATRKRPLGKQRHWDQWSTEILKIGG